MKIVTLNCGGMNWTWVLVGVLSGGSIKILAYDRLHNERDSHPQFTGIGTVCESDNGTRQVTSVTIDGLVNYPVTNPMQGFSYPSLI